MASSRTNKKQAYEALVRLGGRATVRQIAEALGRSVNGVSQTFGSIDGLYTDNGSGGERMIIIPRNYQLKI